MRAVRDWAYGKRRDLFAIAGIVVLGIAFLHEMASMDAVPVTRDIQLFFIPHRHILWASLQQLDLPLWTPLIRTGYPVMANFQSGAFYPPHWLYAVLPFLTAFNLLVVVHVVLGGLGSYLLARQIGFEPPSSFVAGAAFMLGGYFVSLTNLVNALQTAAWAPALSAVLLRHVSRWTLRTYVLGIAVYLLGFLAGAPQTFALGACVALSVSLVWSWDRFESGPPGWWRVVATLGSVSLVVLGLAAVQVLPTLEMISHSGRGVGLTLSEAARYSLEPVRLLHLVIPNAFSDPVYRFGEKLQLAGADPWLYSLYVGVAVLVLAWHARSGGRRWALVLTWVGLALVGLVIGLGTATPVYGWAFDNIPGFDAFRFPEKFLLLTGMAVPMLAAHGLSSLLRRGGPDTVDAVAMLVGCLVALLALLSWSVVPEVFHHWLRSVSPDAPALKNFSFFFVEWGTELEVLATLLVLTVLAVLLYGWGAVERWTFVGLVLVLVSLDLWLAHRALNPVVDPSFYRGRPLIQAELPMEDLRSTYRYRATPFDERTGNYFDYSQPMMTAKWLWQETMQPPTGSLWGVLAQDASDAIHLNLVRAQESLFRELPNERRVRLLRLSSVAYVYTPIPVSALDRSDWRRVDSLPGVLHELHDPLPRAYLAHGRTHEKELDALNAALDPRTDYHREVMLLAPEDSPEQAVRGIEDSLAGVEDSTTESPGSAVSGRDSTIRSLLSPGTAEILTDEGERVSIGVDANTTSFLVLTDTWYPGWHAYADGEERPIRRANYFFRAVRVEPGDETIVFRYEPESVQRGAMISAASLFLLVAGLLSWTLCRRRSEPAATRSAEQVGGSPP